MTPAFDEAVITVYPCRNHPDRVAVEPLAFRRCEECQADALNAYGDAMVKRDKQRWYTSTQWDTDTSGAPLSGQGSREAMHKRNMQARKDKDE